MGRNSNYSEIQKLLSEVWPGWRITGVTGRDGSGDIFEILRNDVGTDFRCSLLVFQMKGDRQGRTITLTRPSMDLSALSPGSVREEDLEKFVRIVSAGIDTMMKLKGIPNIVSIEDYAIIRRRGSRTILIRTEYLEGLGDHLRLIPRFDRREIIALGTDLCTALSHVERLGMIHGNVSAENVFYTDRTGYKLGVSDLFRTVYSVFEGRTYSSTPPLRFGESPVSSSRTPQEADSYQQLSLSSDKTEDIYSLGILLDRIIREYIPPAYRDRALAETIRRACDPDPARRFQSAEQFRAALLECRDNAASSSVSAASEEADHSFSKTSARAVLSAAVVFFLLSICVFFYFRIHGDDSRKKYDLSGTSASVSAGEVNTPLFDDPGLEYAVRSQIGVMDGEITQEMAEAVRSLKLSGCSDNKYGKIKSIAGLSFFPNLEDLDLSDNQISDISDLSELRHLKKLRLKNNRIESIDALQTMQELQELDLSINMVQDISPLKKLTTLTVLDAGSNNITAISGLKGLVNLQYLSLNINHIVDITPLTDLKNLSVLGLEYNEIEDFIPLTGLKNLSRLSLKGNNIKDISRISELSFLSFLDISDNGISDKAPLKKLPDTITVISD